MPRLVLLVAAAVCGPIAAFAPLAGPGRAVWRLGGLQLPLDEVAAKWFVAAKTGCTLRSKNASFVDEQYEVTVDRGGGLGLELEELFCQADGRGLVLVGGVVQDSNAARAVSATAQIIERGDTLLSLKTPDGAEMFVEGRSYDATIAALGKLGDAASVTLRLQRIVPRASVNVNVLNFDGSPRATFQMPSGANLRSAFMLNRIRDPEVYDADTMRFDAIGNSGTNCGGEGTCGTCLISVEKGGELLNDAARVERQVLAKQRRPKRWRWACRLTVGMQNAGGDLTVKLRPQAAFSDEQAKSGGF
ncbi:hypothetical protein M885DRAFT_624002, partial [Pelagophyceae sp. CCMP2097]